MPCPICFPQHLYETRDKQSARIQRKMVNWVAALEPLLHRMARCAGLRLQTVELEPGTVVSIWVPKKKAMVSGRNRTDQRNRTHRNKEKPAVVLVHGFAAEGIVTWQFQFGVLSGLYELYIPDLLFFGRSATCSADRSPAFQAECVAKALGHFGVARCAVVGLSYGGMVAFKMAEMRPDLVHSLVVSGSVIAMTDSISEATLEELGFSSSSELLLPDSVRGLKVLLSLSMYKQLWFPEFLYRDYLEIMFDHRKERSELLHELVISKKDAKVPKFPQRILLLWGENDNFIKLDLALKMKEQLGENTSVRSIEKAGHLVHLERPCYYNRYLKEFLAQVHDESTKKFT